MQIYDVTDRIGIYATHYKIITINEYELLNIFLGDRIRIYNMFLRNKFYWMSRFFLLLVHIIYNIRIFVILLLPLLIHFFTSILSHRIKKDELISKDQLISKHLLNE